MLSGNAVCIGIPMGDLKLPTFEDLGSPQNAHHLTRHLENLNRYGDLKLLKADPYHHKREVHDGLKLPEIHGRAKPDQKNFDDDAFTIPPA